MNPCVRCVGLGIDGIVETYYVLLGLEDWHTFAAKRREQNARSYMQDLERQTGRTAHGILETAALCVKNNNRFLLVSHTQIQDMAQNLLASLGSSVQVGVYHRGYANYEHYEDHFHG